MALAKLLEEAADSPGSSSLNQGRVRLVQYHGKLVGEGLVAGLFKLAFVGPAGQNIGVRAVRAVAVDGVE